MKKVLYLHIGTHKTGSTYIQNALNNNLRTLKKSRIHYIQPFPLRRDIHLSNELNSNLVDSLQKRFDEIINNRKYDRYSALLASYEGFSGNHLIGYYNSGVVSKTLEKALCNTENKIIIYLRRQDLFVESLYTQLLHEGSTIKFDEYCNSLDKSYFNWYDLVKNYEASFGRENIICRIYDQKNFDHKYTLFDDFASLIDIRDYKENESVNKGFSVGAAELAKKCNDYLNDNSSLKLRNYLQKHHSKNVFAPYNLFTFKRRMEFMQNYIDSNQLLKNEYFPGSSALFSPIKAAQQTRKKNSNLDNEMTAILVQWLINLSEENKKLQKKTRIIRKIDGIITSLFE